MSLPESMWEKVLCWDETKVKLFGQNSKHNVWCKPNTSHASRHTNPTVKYGGGRIVLQRCFSSAGIRNLVRIEERMEGAIHRKILHENLLQSTKNWSLGRNSGRGEGEYLCKLNISVFYFSIFDLDINILFTTSITSLTATICLPGVQWVYLKGMMACWSDLTKNIVNL